MRINRLLGTVLIAVLLSKTGLSQQLRLGTNPWTVEKSSVLELQSTNQGLLLTRIADTALINALNPPDGMVVYFTPSKQLLLRANGSWQALTPAASLNNYWSVTGNSNGAVKQLGNIDNYALPFITNNTERMRISNSGNVGIGTTSPSQKLDVNGTIVSSATTYPNYGYNASNRMAFGESNVPANETGSVVQYGSGSSSRNMLFAFTKTNVNTSFLGNDGTQMMLGTESTAPITFRTGLSYTAASIMGSGTEAMRINSTGVGIGTTTPSTKLHIVGTNPLTLTGVQAGTNTTADSLLTITNGLVRKLPMATFANAYTSGNLTETGSNILTITGGTNAVLGSGATVQVKQASGSQSGFLSSTDWTTFDNKLSSIDTTNISNFNVKVRSLFSATAPITLANGLIGITQASTSTNGYLSSTDWNTFNNKLSSIDTTNISNFYVKVRSLFSAGSGISYNASTGVITASGGAGSNWSLTGNTVGSEKKLGTVDDYDLPFITHNTEKMRLTSDGNLGIGTSDIDTDASAAEKVLIDAGTTDSYNLLVAKGERNGYLQFNIQNNSSQGQASTDIVATANNGTETANYVNLGINGGGYNSASNILSGPNNGYLFSAGQDFVVGNTAAAKSLILFTGGIATSNERMRITSAGKVGIGNTSPAEVLDVTGNLRFSGALMPGGSAGTAGYVLTSGGAGSAPTWVTPSAASGSWQQDGNSVASQKTLGTITNFHLPFITNNTERMRITSTGNVGIGTSTFDGTYPEKLLVHAGTTSSYNLINAKGTINNYLQLNIQNLSSGTAASSDVVATANNGTESANFVNMGINSSGYSSTGVLGGANNAYLYSTGNDFVIGNSSSGKDLVFFTGGSNAANERMRIDDNGRVGIGVTDAANQLVVKDTLEIRRTGTLSTLLFSATSGFGDFRIAGDGGDLFWQGGGGRALQMGSYHTTILGGDRQTGTAPAFTSGTANTGVLVQGQRDASVPLAVLANSATQTANLTEWRTSSTTASVVDKNGSLGIATSAPASKLDVNGSAGLGITTTSANLTLNETHYSVIITSGTPAITLPTASTCTRRMYVIVNHTATSRTISAYRDFSNASTTTIAANSSITIQSDGTNWYRIQ